MAKALDYISFFMMVLLTSSKLQDGPVRWYIPTNLPSRWTSDHENPPISVANGLGPYADGPNELQYWNSHWPRFFYWWVLQLKDSPLRVDTYEEADFVFVPMCLGCCGRWSTTTSDLNMTEDEWYYNKDNFFLKAPRYLPHLDEKPHLLIVNSAINGYILSNRDVGKFVIIGLEVPKLSPQLIAAPYPSHEHPHIISASLPHHPSTSPRRSNSLYGLYNNRKALRDHDKLRKRLTHNCMERSDHCKHAPWDVDAPVAQLAELYAGYRNHQYCLQPHADWILRGAFYDCMVSNGLPVVFQPDYTTHAAFYDIFDYSKVVTTVAYKKVKGNLVDHIMANHSQEFISKASQYLHDNAHVFIYAIRPLYDLVTFKDRNVLHPQDDAITFTLKALLRAICHPKSRNWTSTTLPQRCNSIY